MGDKQVFDGVCVRASDGRSIREVLLYVSTRLEPSRLASLQGSGVSHELGAFDVTYVHTQSTEEFRSEVKSCKIGKAMENDFIPFVADQLADIRSMHDNHSTSVDGEMSLISADRFPCEQKSKII